MIGFSNVFVSFAAPLDIKQPSDKVIMRLISKLVIEIWRNLQKLLKNFNGTIILTFFMSSASVVSLNFFEYLRLPITRKITTLMSLALSIWVFFILLTQLVNGTKFSNTTCILLLTPPASTYATVIVPLTSMYTSLYNLINGTWALKSYIWFSHLAKFQVDSPFISTQSLS